MSYFVPFTQRRDTPEEGTVRFRHDIGTNDEARVAARVEPGYLVQFCIEYLDHEPV